MSVSARPDITLPGYSFPLFVPASRPDRFAKAANAGTDTIIVDLEDAVSPSEKVAARDNLSSGLDSVSGASVWIRLNGVDTPWHADDLAALNGLNIQGVILPKAESATTLQDVRRQLGGSIAVIGLIETARGVHNAEEIASACDRLAFGSVDYALDMNCRPTRDAFLLARSRLVLAARLAKQPAPIDGVTTRIDDPDLVETDSTHAFELGFGGKLLIHPAQLAPAQKAFAPSNEDVDWANRIVSHSTDGAASTVDGEMVDAPVLARALGILERQGMVK